MALFNKNNNNNKKKANYISIKESRKISRENFKKTQELERMRSLMTRDDYITEMKDKNNVLEIDNLHTYFFTDIGVVKAVNGFRSASPKGKTVGVVGESVAASQLPACLFCSLFRDHRGKLLMERSASMTRI